MQLCKQKNEDQFNETKKVKVKIDKKKSKSEQCLPLKYSRFNIPIQTQYLKKK